MFKVGDRVVCTAPHDGNSKVVGEHGTVISNSSDLVSVEFDNHIGGHDGAEGSGKYGNCWSFHRDAQDHLKAESSVAYKPGDVVRIIRDTCMHGVSLGTIVTLTEEYSSRLGAFLHTGDRTYVLPNDIELVAPGTPGTTNSASADTKKEKETHIMKIEHKDFINGQDVTGFTLEQEVALIQTTEKRIAELEAISTKTKKVTAEIERLKDALKKALVLFDSVVDTE